MQHARGFGEQEIVHQAAVAHHRLGADPRLIRQQVFHLQGRAVLAALLQVAGLEQRVLHLGGAGAEVLPDGFPETGEAGVLRHVAPVDGELPVVLPAQAQYRVGADGNAAVDHAGQVHPEERQLRIGDRVDQVIDDVVLRRRQTEVFAAEGDDLVVDLHPGHHRQAIRLQAGAGHQLLRLPAAAVAADGDAVGAFLDRGDGLAQADLAALAADHPGHGVADFAVVDDAGGVEEQPAKADDIRFALAQLLGVQALHLQAVLLRALVQGLHALHFQGVGRHQHLAADLELDPVLAAELLGGLGATLAQVGLEAARSVVDACVDHPAVVPGLVLGQDVFLFQDDQRSAGLALEDLHRRSQADDAAADDAKVINHCS